MSTLEEDILAHYGKKGMRWGVRRAEKQSASTDATRVNQFKKTAKRSGTNALSTKELQDLVTRMNLEQQYSKLTPPRKSAAAKKFIADVLVNTGKQQAMKFASDQAAKQIEKMLSKH